MSTGKSRGEGLNCPLLAIPAFAVELFRWRCQGWRHIWICRWDRQNRCSE